MKTENDEILILDNTWVSTSDYVEALQYADYKVKRLNVWGDCFTNPKELQTFRLVIFDLPSRNWFFADDRALHNIIVELLELFGHLRKHCPEVQLFILTAADNVSQMSDEPVYRECVNFLTKNKGIVYKRNTSALAFVAQVSAALTSKRHRRVGNMDAKGNSSSKKRR